MSIETPLVPPLDASSPVSHVPKSGPRKLAVIDIEGSGLRLKSGRADESDASYAALPHRPGVDHDCILEVAVIILDAETLIEETRYSWFVLPPGVDTAGKFDAWVSALKVADPFVFDMHSKKSSIGAPSLLDDLAGLAGRSEVADSYSLRSRVEDDLTLFLNRLTLSESTQDVHPGNSVVMFTGNSIANYDIPMFRCWMPAVVKALSYRIMDVSVLRSFYNTIANVQLPEGLDEAIRSGGNDNHRAMDDCEHCASALRRLTAYARDVVVATDYQNEFLVREEARASAAASAMIDAMRRAEPTPSDVAARVAHLEMLVRYGSRRAIKEERRLIETRDGVEQYSATGADVEPEQGLFRKAGGILRAKPADVVDDFTTNGDGA